MTDPGCTIYVGDIPQVMDEEKLRDIFQPYGQIENLIMKATQKQGSSFALITYSSHEEADRAIREVNYTKVDGHPIRVTWSIPKHQNNEIYDPNANLVISNLPSDIEEQSLHQKFSEYGTILSCRILRNREGISNGRGYIQFQNVEDANRALEDLEGAKINDNIITIERYLPKNQRQNIPTPLPPNVIAIEGPADSLTEEKLRGFFQPFGDIIEITHIDNLGVIFFANNESANNAQKKFHQPGLTITKTVRKEITQHVFEKIESRSIFISDLIEPDEGSLRAHFGQCGEIVSLELHSQSNASVQYRTTQERDAAVNRLDHSSFNGHHNPIKVLPFFDTRIEHPDCGLLVFNELPITTRYLDFRREFSQYGPLLAASIVPTRTGQCVGYVLFKNHADACKAKEESSYRNVFFFPRYSASDFFPIFGNTKGGRCLSVYDPTMTATEAFNILLNKNPPLAVDSNGGVILAFYEDLPSALKGFDILIGRKKEVDISTPSISKWLISLLSYTQIPNEMEQRFTFVRGIKVDNSNAQIRELFESNAPVEAAFMSFNPENGAAKGSAYVLFATPEGASYSISAPPFYEQELNVSIYKNAKSRNIPLQVNPISPAPRINSGTLKPKDTIKKFINGNENDEKRRKQLRKS